MNAQQEQIIHSFSKGSANYDREAYVQGVCAKKVGSFLKAQQHRLIPGEILEIGCGTGFISQEVLAAFPFRKFTITDICPTMLFKCQSNIKPSAGVDFALLDGEQFQEKGRYALIVSGLAFQWFRTFQKSVQRLFEGLKPEGLLLFSFLEANSFPEWQQMCAETDIPYTGNDFPRLAELCALNFPCAHYWEEKITLIYPNALDCLKSFKRIGAGTSLKEKRLTSSQMLQLLKYWDAQSPGGVAITYNIAFAALQKW